MANRKPKIFIIGITGFLGKRLAYHLKDKYIISGCGFSNFFSHPEMQIYPVALKSTDILDTLIRSQNPDVTINACGVTSREFIQENEKAAEAINTMLAVSSAVLSYKIRSKYILLSCSEVYEGKKAKYSESDSEYTLSDVYGKQKISAETYVRSQVLESTTLRIGRVVGIGNPERKNFFDTLRMRAHDTNQIELSKNLTHSYLSVQSFCNAVEMILDAEIPAKHRIFNLGGVNTSEYDFAKRWLEITGQNSARVKNAPLHHALSYGLDTSAFSSAYSGWKAESPGQLFAALLQELSPGVGIKKWQKILQTL